MFHHQLVKMAAAAALLTSVGIAGQPSFQGLGTLPGAIQSWAAGVSADGSTVVGWSYGAGSEGWRWKDGVMIGLGLPSSSAFGASADGSVVVGEMPITSPVSLAEAFRLENGVMSPLGSLPGGGFGIAAHAVSADGSVVAGTTTNGRAFRWQGGVISELPGVPGGIQTSDARGVSADGSVIVGIGYSSFREAFRWENGTISGLGDLPGGAVSSEAYAVSAEGSVIVGTSASSSSSHEAFRWQNGVMVGLGGFPGFFANRANGVSADGSVIVGAANSAVGAQPFIWDKVHGLRNLQDVLTDVLGLDLAGWRLIAATGVSADGLTIVGYGQSAGIATEAWIAHLPEPGMLALLGLAIPMCAGRLRGRQH